MGPEDGKQIMYIWKCNQFVTRLQIDEEMLYRVVIL